MGAMFRAERPQAGRKRQFHQIGIEIINEAGQAADFESVSLLCLFLKYIGLEEQTLRINDLGPWGDRAKIAKALEVFFSKEKSKLCKDCLYRLEKNVLRIFDCKVESCQPVIQKAPWEEIAPLSEVFKKLTADLEAHKIPFEIHRRLVRGLDYYTGSVFEVVAQGLGAQDAVAGGGRYDHLYGELGGADTPCTGFSIGVERLLIALEKTSSLAEQIRNQTVYLAPLDASCEFLSHYYEKATMLREQGIRIETTPAQTSLSSHLKKANQMGLRFVLILGPDEIKKGVFAVKDLKERKQTEIKAGEIVSYMMGVMKS